MTAHPSPIFSSAQRRLSSTSSSLPFSVPPKPSTSTASTSHARLSHRYSPIDLSEIEIVDLTEPSSPQNPQPASRRRRPSDSSSLERPPKRAKGKDKEVYISLEDDEKEVSPSSSSSQPQPLGTGNGREKSPVGGLLTLYKCVICLDSPTDIVATPCGTNSSPSGPSLPLPFYLFSFMLL